MRRRRRLLVGLLVVAGLVVGLRHLGNAPVDPQSTMAVVVEIPAGSGAREIGRVLRRAGVLRSPLGFTVAVVLRGARAELRAGRYEFSPRESGSTILRRLRRGEGLPDDLAVTLPEGFTLRQIADRLDSREIIAREVFLDAARAERFRGEFSFLADVPDGASLEGYLFPDTYRLKRGMAADEILRRLLRRFDEQYARAQRETAARPLSILNSQQLSTHQVVTLASIVEREVKTSEDRRLVAGILWGRFAAGRGLEADATIRYVLDQWEAPLTAADLRVDSPYNTRRYRGLPPGPVGNPGFDSLRAALQPAPSNFRYYLSAPDGKTIFSATLEEHAAARLRHLPRGEFSR